MDEKFIENVGEILKLGKMDALYFKIIIGKLARY